MSLELSTIESFRGLLILGNLVALLFLLSRVWKLGRTTIIFGGDVIKLWQKGAKIEIKVGDKWRTITEIKTNEDGTWKTIKRNVPKPMTTRR